MSAFRRALLSDATTTDAYWNNTQILLRGESGVDSSQYARTVTTAGVTYGTPSKFGNACLYPNTTGTNHQTVTYNVAHQLGTGNFTIEGWIYKLSHTSSAGNQVFYQHGASGAAGLGIYLTTAGGIDMAGNNTYFCGVPAATLSLNTWYHVAVVRTSGTAGIFLNGVLSSNLAANAGTKQFEACTATFNYTNNPRVGASNFSNGSMRGSLDDFRLTVGIARYTSTFTPPGELPITG